MTKWIISSFSFLIFATVLFINLQNNSEINDEFNTNLANVTNEEMESVIDQNPDIYPMRMALANRYFDDLDYSQALPHYMYIAENSADNELKSFALAQIGWMVYESNNLDVATTYLNESLRINSESLVAKSYLGIIYIQDPAKQNVGLEILNSVIQSNKLSKEDRNFIVEILENYEK
jgi:tetratricopeptide (TPR) repeat protein